jgi:hypothetical protein
MPGNLGILMRSGILIDIMLFAMTDKDRAELTHLFE